MPTARKRGRLWFNWKTVVQFFSPTLGPQDDKLPGRWWLGWALEVSGREEARGKPVQQQTRPFGPEPALGHRGSRDPSRREGFGRTPLVRWRSSVIPVQPHTASISAISNIQMRKLRLRRAEQPVQATQFLGPAGASLGAGPPTFSSMFSLHEVARQAQKLSHGLGAALHTVQNGVRPQRGRLHTQEVEMPPHLLMASPLEPL